MRLTTAQLSHLSDLETDTILAMRRDGLLHADFVDGTYVFGAQETEIGISIIDAANDNLDEDDALEDDEYEEDVLEDSDWEEDDELDEE